MLCRWFIEMVVDGHVHVHGSNARFVGLTSFFSVRPLCLSHRNIKIILGKAIDLTHTHQRTKHTTTTMTSNDIDASTVQEVLNNLVSTLFKKTRCRHIVVSAP